MNTFSPRRRGKEGLMSSDETLWLPVVYIIYALLSVGLTVWLARLLSRHGQVFLEDVFNERPELAFAVNRLLVVGFYLFNFGYACLLLEGGYAPDLRGAIETLSSKLGGLLLSLAVMHFLNLFVFHRIRRRAQRGAHPPVRPTAYVPASGTVVPGRSEPAQGPSPERSPAPSPA
jgi:hypothetical protein